MYEVADHVATITLNRPDQLNAFTNAMVHEMIDAFDRVDADDDVRAVIVTGAGRGFLCGCRSVRRRQKRSPMVAATSKHQRECRETAAAWSRCGSSIA